MPQTTIGTAVEPHDCPTFTNFIPDEQTWKIEDITTVSNRNNHQSRTVVKGYNNRGKRATCTWMVKDGQTPAVKGDIVEATFADTTAVGATAYKFSVEEVSNHPDETGIMLQDVTLEHLDSMTYA